MNTSLYYLLAGRLFQLFYSLITIKVVTYFLSQGEVGHYYVILSITSWFSYVLINPVGTYYNRHYHEWKNNHWLKASFRSLNFYFLGVALLSFPVLFFARYFFSVAANISIYALMSLAALHVFVGSWFFTLCPTLNLFGRTRVFVGLTALAQFVGLLSSLAFIFFASKTALSWFLGALLGQAVAAICALSFYKKHFFLAEEARGMETFFNKKLLQFSLPVLFITLFLWFQMQGYRLVVEPLLGAEFLAYIGVALGLATSASGVIEAIVGQYLQPDFYREVNTEDSKQRQFAWEKMWKKSFVVYFFSMTFVAAAASLWLRLLTNPTYASAANLLRWGAAIELVRMLTSVLYLVSHSEKQTSKSVIPYFLGALCLCVCLLFFVRGRSAEQVIIGLPLGILLSSTVTLFCTYISMKKLLPIQLSATYLFRRCLWGLPLLFFAVIPVEFSFSIQLVLYAFLGALAIFRIRKEIA